MSGRCIHVFMIFDNMAFIALQIIQCENDHFCYFLLEFCKSMMMIIWIILKERKRKKVDETK